MKSRIDWQEMDAQEPDLYGMTMLGHMLGMLMENTNIV